MLLYCGTLRAVHHTPTPWKPWTKIIPFPVTASGFHPLPAEWRLLSREPMTKVLLLEREGGVTETARSKGCRGQGVQCCCGQQWVLCFLMSHLDGAGVSPAAPGCGADSTGALHPHSGNAAVEGWCLPQRGGCCLLPPGLLPVPKACRLSPGMVLVCGAQERVDPKPSHAEVTVGNVPREVIKAPAASREPVGGAGSPAKRRGGEGAPGFAATPVEFNDSEIRV